jgi:hypothetical protein
MYWCLRLILTWRDWLKWMEGREMPIMQKYGESNTTRIMMQLYVTWHPVRNLENFKPLDFCWAEGTRTYCYLWLLCDSQQFQQETLAVSNTISHFVAKHSHILPINLLLLVGYLHPFSDWIYVDTTKKLQLGQWGMCAHTHPRTRSHTCYPAS